LRKSNVDLQKRESFTFPQHDKNPVILDRKGFWEVYMKKLGIVVIMALVAVGMSFADAVPGTGDTLTVNATIKPVLTATLTGNTLTFGGSTGLDTTVTGAVESSNTVTLKIISNYPHYTVTFTSGGTPKGQLKSSSTTTDVTIPYSLKAALVETTWANAPHNDLTDFAAMSANRVIGDASGNHKTPVQGLTYTLSGQLTMPSGMTEMLETGTTFTDSVVISITAP
jgi:hypothetical protein